MEETTVETKEVNVKYCVMRMMHEIVVSNGKQEFTIPMQGMAGYLAVYDTEEEATIASENGTYQILTLTLGGTDAEQ